MTELIGRVRAFVDDELIPLEPKFLSTPFRELEGVLEDKRAAVRQLGLFNPHLPEAWGGLGLSLSEFGEVAAVLARTPIGHYVFNCQAPDAGNAELLIMAGSGEQQERFLRPLAEGKIRSCFAMTEPEHAGSNPIHMSTVAVRDGDAYVIDGHKWFTTGADGAAWVIVMAVTDPDAKPHQRASMFVLPTDTPGFRIVRNLPLMGHAGSGHDSHAEVRFEGCRVPVTARIGDEGAGFALAQKRLGPGRIHHCMRFVGIAERAIDLLVQRAASRDLGSGVRLADKQLVQAWIAESYAEARSCRLFVEDTARRIDAHGARAVRAEVSAIKFHVAGMLQRVLDRALQAYGGAGMLDEDVPLAWWYRHERAARIYDGADEVHKAVVARRLLARGTGTL